MKSQSVTIQMKASEQYFPVVLFIMLYKVVVPFEYVDEILKCDHSTEQYFPAVLFMLDKVVLTFESQDELPNVLCYHKMPKIKTFCEFIFRESEILEVFCFSLNIVLNL